MHASKNYRQPIPIEKRWLQRSQQSVFSREARGIIFLLVFLLTFGTIPIVSSRALDPIDLSDSCKLHAD